MFPLPFQELGTIHLLPNQWVWPNAYDCLKGGWGWRNTYVIIKITKKFPEKDQIDLRERMREFAIFEV